MNAPGAHEQAIARAQRVIRGASRGGCAWRPGYHFTAPTGWINDPNGLLFHRGVYHLFYQHYPHAAKWGPMHWGHATSRDLIHWQDLPVALAPSEPYDLSEGACGCWSGSAISVGDSIALLYTGHSETHEPKETQNLATSDDGVHFVKHPANPVIGSVPADASKDFRDPRVWRHGGNYYVAIGTGKDGVGKVLLYRSRDLIEWHYMGVMAQSDGTLGTIWECPDVFELDGKHVLIFSPIGLGRPLSMYLIGELDYETGRFREESRGMVDFGSDFYAPQTMADDGGRRILIGWMQAWGAKVPTEANGWSGAMTIPRELRIHDGVLCQRPVGEVETMRGEHVFMGDIRTAASDLRTLPVEGDCCELKMTLAGARPAVRVRCGGSQFTEIRWDRDAGTLVVDRGHSGLGDADAFSAPAPAGQQLAIRVLIDRSSVEVLTADGRAAITCRVYPEGRADGLQLGPEGEYRDVHFWQLRP